MSHDYFKLRKSVESALSSAYGDDTDLGRVEIVANNMAIDLGIHIPPLRRGATVSVINPHSVLYEKRGTVVRRGQMSVDVLIDGTTYSFDDIDVRIERKKT